MTNLALTQVFNQPNDQEELDREDSDVASHITYFAQDLRNNLSLKKVLESSLDNPQEAIMLLNKVRAEVAEQLRKVQALKALTRRFPQPSLRQEGYAEFDSTRRMFLV